MTTHFPANWQDNAQSDLLRGPHPDRLDCKIAAEDRNWTAHENEFRRLHGLGITIDALLNQFFSPHEKRLFFPSGNPSVFAIQRRHADGYTELLKGQLQGGEPRSRDAIFKLTAMYFGLPIEPLAMGLTLAETSSLKSSLQSIEASGFLSDFTTRGIGSNALQGMQQGQPI